MPSVAEILMARVDEPVRDELRAIPDLETRLDALIRAGADAHPDLVVDEDAWATHLARHLRSGEAAAELRDIRAADVHLVLACLSGSPVAHRRLDAALRTVAAQALIGIRLGGLSLEELLQEVRTKLLVGEGVAPTRRTRTSSSTRMRRAVEQPRATSKLASYSGRGPLEGWLRVTLTRAALSILRSRSPEAPRPDDSDALAELAAAGDPQLAALRARCAPALERAISNTLASLPAEERTLLRLYFVDGLTIDDLAAVYRAHRATMARRLARVRSAVFERARAETISTLGLAESEFQSLMGVIMSALDLTIRTALDAMPREKTDKNDESNR